MFCTSCGLQAESGSQFCARCGQALGSATVPSEAAAPAGASHPAVASQPVPLTTVTRTTDAQGPIHPTADGAATAGSAGTAESATRGFPRIEPFRPTSGQLAADLRWLGITGGGSLLVAFVLVGLVAMTVVPDAVRGGVLEWLRWSMLLFGISHGAQIGLDGSIVDSELAGNGSAVLRLVPLGLWALVVWALVTGYRRAEAQAPSGSSQQAWGRLGISAGLYALVVSLLAIVLRGPVPGADLNRLGLELSMGLTPLSTLLATFLTALVAGCVARPPWHLVESVRKRVGGYLHAARVLVTALAGAALIGVIYAVISLILQSSTAPTAAIPTDRVTSGASVSDTVSLLLGLAAFLPNVVLAIAGLSEGISSSLSGSAASVEGATHMNVLTEQQLSWIWHVLPILAWIIALVSAARLGLRRDPRRPLGQQALQLGSVSVAGALLICMLTSVSLSASGNSSMHSALTGSGEGQIGLDSGSALLVGVLLGAIFLVGERWLLPELAGAFPAWVSRFARRGMHPVWGLRLADAVMRQGGQPSETVMDLADQAAGEQVTPLANHRRQVRLALGGVAAIAVVGALVGIAGAVFGSLYGPGRTVGSYAEGLRSGSAHDALATLSVPEGTPPALLTDAVLKSSSTRYPISEISIEELPDSGNGDHRYVRLSYLQDDTRVERTLYLVRTGSTLLGLAPSWRIEDGLATVSVDTAGRAATLAGADVGVPSSLVLLPGLYELATKATPLEAAASATVAVGRPDSSTVQLERTLAPGAQAAVRAAVQSKLAECAKATVLDPPGCPNDYYAFGDVQSVRWTAPTDTSVSIDDTPTAAGLSFYGTGTFGLSYISTATSFSPASPQDTTDRASFSGTATVSGGSVSVTLQ
ncbi:zinc ribbon domain-containing protein [Arsenicicoccus piscis]|uniref:zinc ribbon domain-containing protein n=1 Tax=Arsenicicoccus piscis TaxID=673954 RepID=UPI001F4CC5FA|nr:zinc ribbon domain-containing protein [Arsenicicoccus piscis]MCH8626780.1 zinc ribbon domain-containing protein [Arsenicicoccus piscis]MCH8628729.1 zinc ribbon domain-containing protein [Arsenicicoccus piscis]